MSAPASADTQSFTAQGCSTWTVPLGVSTIGIDAIGAAGASSKGPAGTGDEVSGAVAVTHGQTLNVCVGVNGGQGGAGGSGSGGAGGGASGVSLGSNFSSPLLVAAGGGGGGAGAVTGGSGGSAGYPNGGGTAGGTQSAPGGNGGFGTGGPGGSASGAGTYGGGGGGAGYYGGGGGGASGVTAGGGGGGSDYCPSGCTHVAAPSSQAPEVTLRYTVASAPTASIATPSNGAVYPLGGTGTESFSCAEGSGGPGVSACTDQSGRGSGAPIDTSTTGTHTVTVTAVSADGLSSTSSVTYTVAAPPRIWLPLPANGATFTLGQVVHSWYLCGDGTGGPGIRSCADQNGQPSGATIDTSTPGVHSFTVTATSEDGQTSSVTNSYRVVPVPTVAHVVAHRGGVVTLSVTTYAPGAIDVMNTAGLRSFALAADVARAHAAIDPPNGSFVFGSAHVVSAQPKTLQVRVGLSQAGTLLLRDHRRATLRLWVLYTTPGGTPQLVKSLSLRVSR